MIGVVPRVSAELFTIPLDDGRFLVYAPLRRTAFVTNAAVVNGIVDLQEGLVEPLPPATDELVEFLQRLEILDGGEEIRPITHYTGNPKPTSVTLFLTTACNLRCTYCYASAGDTPTRVMPLDVAKKGIDFVTRNAVELGQPGIEVALHGGGEPSVNWATLTGAIEYAKERAAALATDPRSWSKTPHTRPDNSIQTPKNTNSPSTRATVGPARLGDPRAFPGAVELAPADLFAEVPVASKETLSPSMTVSDAVASESYTGRTYQPDGVPGQRSCTRTAERGLR